MKAQVKATKIAANALALGISGGLRSQVPITMVSQALRSEPNRFGRNAGWKWLRNDAVGNVLNASLVGELFVDKLPVLPARITPGPLFGRIAMGALSGAAFGSAVGRGTASVLLGSVLGGAGAVIGAYAGYYARTRIAEATGLPDAVFAVVEDASAVAIGSVAARP